MPELIQCPKCNRKLRVPDNLLGKKVKCPSCSTAFTAAAAEEELPTAPLIEKEEAPRPVRRRVPPPPEQEDEDQTSRNEDEDEPRPRGRKRSVEDDYEEEVRPSRRKRPVEDDYEEEEEEEDVRPRRPRRGRSYRARSAVAAPAISLMVLGGLSLALYLVQLILLLAGVDLFGWQEAARQAGQGQGGQNFVAAKMFGGVIGTIVAMSWAGIVLSAGLRMKNLQGFGHAMTGSIIAMLPCNICCLLGIPFGIWSLVVLNKPEVKSAFR